ncbi:MAG: hypothetical protein V7L20_28945 [Nostoc sp.]
MAGKMPTPQDLCLIQLCKLDVFQLKPVNIPFNMVIASGLMEVRSFGQQEGNACAH